MLNLIRLFRNKSFRLSLILIISLAFVYIILRLTVFASDPLIPILNSLYKTYLIFPEWIANLFFESTNAGVIIVDHQFVFESETFYHINYSKFLGNWTKYLLYKRFSVLTLFVIWFNISKLRKKIIFSLLFIIVHIISVLGGLYLLGVALPELVNEQTDFFVSPTLVGTFTMLILIIVWVLYSKEEIRDTLVKLNINTYLSDRRIHEILIILFLFSILRNILIPFIAYEPYVIFLLEITRRVASIFNYDGYIIGDQLVGENGALALSKHCLGFMTMYIFAAMVYLTRPIKAIKTTGVFILAGLTLVFILNIIRLIFVFIVAQGENGFERASLHHEVYNISIYVFIFLLWVFWFELVKRKFPGQGSLKKQN